MPDKKDHSLDLRRTDGFPFKVLVVDDHADTAELIGTVLTLAGFDIVCSTEVSEALELALDGFDAVCTDLNMPGMDGFDFIRAVRQKRPNAIPIVVVSAQPADEVATAVDDAGACWFLPKPCNADELVRVVRMLLGECARDCPDGLCTCAARRRR